MPDNIFLGELDLTDPVYALQYLHGLYQSGRGSRRKVYLRDISGDDHLGVHTQAGQEHLDLMRRRVLRLVQYNDGVVQGTTAHKR